MKLLFKSAGVLILVLGLLSGCGVQNSYQALVYSFSDSDIGVSHTYEYSYWQEPINEADVKQTLTVDIDGKEFSGTYDRCYRISPNNYAEYQYTDSENNSFTVDENGNITRFSLGKTADHSTEKSVTEEEALTIARDFLTKYANPDHYRFALADYFESSQYYCFEFMKYIEGLPTSDSGNIIVSSSGEVEGFNFFMLGKIPMDTRFSFDIENVRASLTQKLDTLYSEAKSQYERVEYEFHEDEFLFTILENGEKAMVCGASIHCYVPMGDETWLSGERISFVVTNDAIS